MEDEQINKNISFCQVCGKKALCKGLCKYHYYKQTYNPEKHKQYIKKWKDKNPNYFKEYYLNHKEKKQ